MNEFYSLDIEIPEIDVNVYKARLYIHLNEIELKIYYKQNSPLHKELMKGVNKIALNDFGKSIKVSLKQNSTENQLKKIDISEAKIISYSGNITFHKDTENYVTIKIDTAKFYWEPEKEITNTAEFYLDDKGFKVVAPFYGAFGAKSFFKNDGKFEIKRMGDSTDFYKLGKSLFRPEFYIYSQDKITNKTATITKEPKIQFKYQGNVTEKESLFYGDIVLMLASFYHHTKINYKTCKIHLPESSIAIKNIEQESHFDKKGNLWGFEIYWNFNKFLQSSWQDKTVKNFDILSKVVDLFNQSHLVDNTSAFLIRFNIIEICDNLKENNSNFTFTLNKKEIKEKRNKALEILLDTIDIKDHEIFKKRWEDIQQNLQKKPMQNKLVSFLKNQNIDPKILPIKINKLRRLRNDLVHGSVDKVDLELLRKANILLYRINGILILNLMGIKDWKLNTQIN